MNEPHEEQISMSYKYFTNHKKNILSSANIGS